MKKAYNLETGKEIEVNDSCYTDKIHEDSVCPYCNKPLDQLEAHLSSFLFIKGESIPICLKCYYYEDWKGRWSEEYTAYQYNKQKERIQNGNKKSKKEKAIKEIKLNKFKEIKERNKNESKN